MVDFMNLKMKTITPRDYQSCIMSNAFKSPPQYDRPFFYHLKNIIKDIYYE